MLINVKSVTFVIFILVSLWIGFMIGVSLDYLERENIFCEFDRNETMKEIEKNVFQLIIKCGLG